MKPELIANLFLDIWCEGSVTIRRAKLLALFGRLNDTQGFWTIVQREWNEARPDVALYARQWGDTYTLTCMELEPVTNWTGRE